MIYLLDKDNSISPMTEYVYDQETDLQDLIIRNPNLVLRNPNENGSNLVLVSREYSIDEDPLNPNVFSRHPFTRPERNSRSG